MWGPYDHFTKLALARPLMPLVMNGSPRNCLTQPFQPTYILIAAAGVTAALGHWVDTVVILGVVTIKVCQQAGISVKRTTGDHAGTAKSMGREMGIGDGGPAVTSAELEAASDD